MPVIFSKQCEYALQAVVYMAQKPRGESFLVRQLAEALHIPLSFLAKTLQILARENLIDSSRGPRGGFILPESTARKPLLDIVRVIDGLDLLERCVLGLPMCSAENQCALHANWEPIRDGVRKMLTRYSVQELASLQNLEQTAFNAIALAALATRNFAASPPRATTAVKRKKN